VKAIWKGVTVAESNDTVVVEGNHYFPPDAVNMDYMILSRTETVCPWKGVAEYFTIKVGEKLNEDAAWFYPETREAAKNIQGRVAFWHGVEVTG
jgi:uncharacterized protein (DUF427 family)